VLPLDPPRPDATRSAASSRWTCRGRSARRRDRCATFSSDRVVGAAGAVVAGGGRVVKNVAGYDLPKLHVGALGTLGVVVEATFKVRPRPRREEAVVVACRSVRVAAETAVALLDETVPPCWLEVAGPGSRRSRNGAAFVAGVAGGDGEVAARGPRDRCGARARLHAVEVADGAGLRRGSAHSGGTGGRHPAGRDAAERVGACLEDVAGAQAAASPRRRAGSCASRWRAGRRRRAGRAAPPALRDRGLARRQARHAGGEGRGRRLGRSGPGLALMRGVKQAFDPGRLFFAPGGSWRDSSGIPPPAGSSRARSSEPASTAGSAFLVPDLSRARMEADSPRGRIHLMRTSTAARSRRVRGHRLDSCLGAAVRDRIARPASRTALIEAARPYVEPFRPGPLPARALTADAHDGDAPSRGISSGGRSVGARGFAVWRDGSKGTWLAYAAALPPRPRLRLPALLEPRGAAAARRPF
jgi:hypothetical protein